MPDQDESSKAAEAAQAARDALAASPVGHPSRARYLSNLGAALQRLALQDLAEPTHRITTLRDAVKTHREALAAAPEDSPDRAWFLSGLGTALWALWRETRQASVLAEAVQAFAAAVAATPEDSPDRAGYLSGLGTALWTLSRETGQASLREEAVQALRDAADASPADHPDYPSRLNNLGGALRAVAVATGSAALRQEADRALRAAAAAAAAPAEAVRRGGIPQGGGSSGGGGEAARQEPGSPERFLVAQLPARVPELADVSLVVRVTVNPPAADAASASLPGLQVGADGARVTVVVQAPRDMVPLEALEQVIWVPPRQDSQPVRFAFRAQRAGLQKVVVTAWAGGTFLAELVLEVSVEQGGPYLDGPPRAAVVDAVQAEPGEVTLQVRSDGERYTFQLLSEQYLFEPVMAEAVTAQPGLAVERLVRTLRGMALGGASGGYSAGNARMWLEQAGVGLWNDMVPQLIKEQFWQLRGSIAAFSIAAGRDIIPWELLYPLAPGRDEGFLAEQFPVMRRVYGQQRSRRIALEAARYVIPSGSPANAQEEAAAIGRILGQGEPAPLAIGDLGPLVGLIESGQAGLLHFTCHNTFAADAGGSAIAMGGGLFVPELLNKAVTLRSLAARHPLVFINACRSARAVPEYTRMMGWAEQFMAAGAGAFIGTMWAVRSESAAVFAETFYGALADGSRLGQACQRARQEISGDPVDPTWLAYSVFGDPAAQAVVA